MKLIKPSFEIIEQESGLDGIYKQIERAGRTCYKNENKIIDDSAKKFVDMLTKSGHGAMLEHNAIYLKFDLRKDYNGEPSFDFYDFQKYTRNKYSDVNYFEDFAYVSTNYRVLVENDWLVDLKYMCEPTDEHEKRVTVKFICDRAIANEFVRHRVFSFAQESTRYCNYSKNKFDNELTFIVPSWCENINEKATIDFDVCNTREKMFLQALKNAEDAYLILLGKWENKSKDKGFKTGFKGNPWKPEQARNVLPLALKTELVMTGFVKDWEHFFELRCDKSAHLQARELAVPLRDEFIKRGYINE